MSAFMRSRSGWRHILAALAVLALMLKLLVPAGFMPGTSLSQPIMLCPDQGTMPIMAMDQVGDHIGHRDPAKSHHGDGEHPCPFAGVAAAATVADIVTPVLTPAFDSSLQLTAAPRAVVPGRGLAAPPPPSHAPPHTRA